MHKRGHFKAWLSKIQQEAQSQGGFPAVSIVEAPQQSHRPGKSVNVNQQDFVTIICNDKDGDKDFRVPLQVMCSCSRWFYTLFYDSGTHRRAVIVD
jgi:hypothetical protein